MGALLASHLSEPEAVELLARGYRASGASVGELCLHNAGVASTAGEAQLAQAWEARGGGAWPHGLVGGEAGMRVQGMLGFWSA